MDFLKKHYDKIILSAVLLGMVGFLVFLPFAVSHEQTELQAKKDSITSPKVQPLPELDMMAESNAAARVETPVTFDFTSSNRLFNPLEWKRAADGSLFPIRTGNEIGPGAVTVSRIIPLYFVLSFDRVETNGITPRYVTGVERQAAMIPALRKPQARYVSMDDPKKDAFTLLQVKGDPENPDALVLKLADSGDTVTITRDKPYRRVEGYAADLRYDPEKKNFPARRVGYPISIAGGDYIVVAITADEVILFDPSNQKKTTLRYTP